MAYASLIDIREYLGISETSEDAFLLSIANRATAIIDTVTKRRFRADTDETRYFNAIEDVDGRMLWLASAGDLASLTNVVNGDGQAIPPSEYLLEPQYFPPFFGIILKSGSTYRWTYEDMPENAISVTGRWAYSVEPPEDITHACIRLSAFLYRQKDTSADLDRPIHTMDGSILMPSSIPSDVSAILQRYARRI